MASYFVELIEDGQTFDAFDVVALSAEGALHVAAMESDYLNETNLQDQLRENGYMLVPLLDRDIPTYRVTWVDHSINDPIYKMEAYIVERS